MAWETYGVKYDGDSAGIVAAHKAIEATAVSANSAVVTLLGSLKKLGSSANASKLTQLTTALNSLVAACNALNPAATNAGTALKGVGQGTSTVTTTTSKVNKLTAAMQANQAQAVLTTSAMQGLGAASIATGGKIAVNTGEASKLTSGFGRLLTAGLALKGFKIIFGEMGDAIRKAREEGERVADNSLDRRAKTKELSNLMGESAGSNRVMASVFSNALSSGMSFDQSLKFLEQAEGAIPAGIKKGNVREDQKGEIFAEAASAADRAGLDPTTAGVLAGIIPMTVDLNNQKDAKGNKMTAREAFAAQMESLVYSGNEGLGKVSTHIQNDIGVAASAVQSGRLKSIVQAGGFVSSASLISSKTGRSGTTFQQMDALLNATGEDGGAGFLSQIGVDKEDGDLAKFRKLKAHIDTVKPKDVNSYLYDQGFHNDAERRSTVGFLSNSEILEKTLAVAEQKARDGKGAMANNAKHLTSLTAQNQIAMTRNEAAEDIQGREREPYMIAVRNATARLRQKGDLTSEDQLFADKISGGMGASEFFGNKSPFRERIERDMAHEATISAKNAGIDLENGPNKRVFRDRHGDLKFYNDKEAGVTPESTVKMLGEKGISIGGDAGIGAQLKYESRIPTAIPPIGGAGAPAGGGGPQASIDASGLDSAASALMRAASALEASAGGKGAVASSGGSGRNYATIGFNGDQYYPARPGGAVS